MNKKTREEEEGGVFMYKTRKSAPRHAAGGAQRPRGEAGAGGGEEGEAERTREGGEDEGTAV